MRVNNISARKSLLLMLGFVSFSLFGAPWHILPVWGAQAGFKYLVAASCIAYFLGTSRKVSRSACVLVSIMLLFWLSFWFSTVLSLHSDIYKIVRFFDRVVFLSFSFLFVSPIKGDEVRFVFFGVLIGGVGMLANILIFGEATHNGRINIAGSFTQTISVGRDAGAGMVAAFSLLVIINSKKLKVALGCVIISLAWATLVAGSRGPMLAAIMSIFVIVVMLCMFKKYYLLLLLTFLLIVFCYWVLDSTVVSDAPRALDILSSDGSTARNTESRFHQYSLAWEAFLQNPIFGLGSGGFVFFSGGYPYPHNIFLEVMSEGGLVAFVPFLFFCFYVAFSIIRKWGHPNAAIISGLLVYFLINASVSFSFEDNEGFWLACVFCVCCHFNDNNSVV